MSDVYHKYDIYVSLRLNDDTDIARYCNQIGQCTNGCSFENKLRSQSSRVWRYASINCTCNSMGRYSQDVSKGQWPLKATPWNRVVFENKKCRRPFNGVYDPWYIPIYFLSHASNVYNVNTNKLLMNWLILPCLFRCSFIATGILLIFAARFSVEFSWLGMVLENYWEYHIIMCWCG